MLDDVSVVRGGRLIWSEGTFKVPAGGVVGGDRFERLRQDHAAAGDPGPAPGCVGTVSGARQAAPATATPSIGYVPQNYAAGARRGDPGCDAVLLGLNGRPVGVRPRRRRAERRRVDEALDAVGASDFADRRTLGALRRPAATGRDRPGAGRPTPKLLHPRRAAGDPRPAQPARDRPAARPTCTAELGVTILVVAHDLNPLLPRAQRARSTCSTGTRTTTPSTTWCDEELLTHLYGTPIEVVRTPQGDLLHAECLDDDPACVADGLPAQLVAGPARRRSCATR